MWSIHHHIFLLNDEKTQVKCCRYNISDSKPTIKNSREQIMDIGARVEDIVYDCKYKICFVVTADCKAHAYRYSQSELRWTAVAVLKLSAQCNNLSGSVVCTNARLYWQTCVDEVAHKYTISYTEYQVQLGTHSTQAIHIIVSTEMKLLCGCFPVNLIASKTNTVLALPKQESIKSLVILVTTVKVVISHLLCGVIASRDHLLAPVQFGDVALSIISALKASKERVDAKLAYVVSDGEGLIAVSTHGKGWLWSTQTNTFHLSAIQVPPHLLDMEPVLLDRVLVWPQISPIQYIDISTNTLHNKSIDTKWSVNCSCYSNEANCIDILLLTVDDCIVSLSKLLDLNNITTLSKKEGPQVMHPTPTPSDIKAMNEELQSILPQVTYSSHLIPQHLDQLGSISTPFTQEMANAFSDHNHKMTNLKQSMNVSVSVTVDTVMNILHTVNSDNLPQVLSTLTHYADVSKQTCLNAFNTFLISTPDMDHWRSLFRVANQKSGSTPLANLYLYLIWQLESESIVDSVLMVGSKYKECMSANCASTMLVDSLLDVIEQSISKLDRNRLLLYSQLCMLSSSEDRILVAVRLLQAAHIDVDTLIDKYAHSSPHRHKLVKQLTNITRQKEA